MREVEAIVSSLKEKGEARTTRRKRLFSTVEKELKNRLAMPVKITGSLNKGNITLKFCSNQELEKILLILRADHDISAQEALLINNAQASA